MDLSMHRDYKRMVAPDGGYGWVVVGAATITTALTATTATIIGILFNYIMEKMSASATQVATIASVLSFTANLTGPFSASYALRTSCRRAIILGGLILASSLFCSMWVKSIQLLILTMGCMLGIGTSFAVNASLFLINDYFVKRRGLAIGIRTTGFSLGRALSPPLFQYLLFEYGYQGLLLISSAILLNMCVCGALYQPVKRHLVCVNMDKAEEPLNNNGQDNEDEILKSAHAHVIFDQLNKSSNEKELKTLEDKDKFPDLLEKVEELCKAEKRLPVWKRIYITLLGQINFSIMKMPTFYLLLNNYLANSLIIFFAILFLYPFAISRGLGSIQATYIMSAFGFSDIIGRLIITSLMDFPKLGAKTINIACCFASATMLLCLTNAYSFMPMLLVVCFLGFCIGGQLSGFVVLCTICVGTKNVPTVMGLSQFFQAFVLLAFGPILGKIRDMTNDFRICYYILASFSYLAALVWIIEICIRRRQTRSAKAKTVQFE